MPAGECDVKGDERDAGDDAATNAPPEWRAVRKGITRVQREGRDDGQAEQVADQDDQQRAANGPARPFHRDRTSKVAATPEGSGEQAEDSVRLKEMHVLTDYFGGATVAGAPPPERIAFSGVG